MKQFILIVMVTISLMSCSSNKLTVTLNKTGEKVEVINSSGREYHKDDKIGLIYSYSSNCFEITECYSDTSFISSVDSTYAIVYATGLVNQP